MKGLSVRQPWAWLIFHGKDVENRSWPTKLRGRIYIHAGLREDDVVRVGLILKSHQIPLLRSYLDSYPHGFGCIIGEVDIVDCVWDHPSPWAEPGMWHWVLANPVAYEKPIPYKGRQGLFEVVKP